MIISKYDGNDSKATKSSGSYIYLITNGEHPNKAKKAVLTVDSKFTNIASYPRRKEVYQFLETEAGNAAIFRIDSKSKQTWSKVDKREEDYCIEDFTSLFKTIESTSPELLSKGIWRDAINELYGVSAYTWRRFKAPFTHGTADGEKYRELRFVETGLRNLEYLVKDIEKRNVSVAKISEAERADVIANRTNADGQSQIAFEMQKGGYAKVTFNGTQPRVLLNKGLFQINQPMWRIKLKSEVEWTIFCAVNLGATNCFVEFLRANGVQPFSTLLSDGEEGRLCDLFGVKNHYEELGAVLPLIDIEVLVEADKWEPITESHYSPSPYQKNKASELYGVTLLEGLHRSITHKSAQLACDANDLIAYKNWCEKIKPTFEGTKRQQSTVRSRAAKSVTVKDYSQTTNAITEAQKEKRQRLAIDCFKQHWQSIHDALSMTAPKLEVSGFHDASNRRKEFYVDIDGDHVKVATNSGVVVHRVNDELDDKGTSTIEYVNPKFDIDGTYTMAQYLSLKAAESIAEHIANNAATYASHVSKLQNIKPTLWKKQVPVKIVEMLS